MYYWLHNSSKHSAVAEQKKRHFALFGPVKHLHRYVHIERSHVKYNIYSISIFYFFYENVKQNTLVGQFE